MVWTSALRTRGGKMISTGYPHRNAHDRRFSQECVAAQRRAPGSSDVHQWKGSGHDDTAATGEIVVADKDAQYGTRRRLCEPHAGAPVSGVTRKDRVSERSGPAGARQQ